MSIGEIHNKMMELKQLIFDKLSEIGQISVPAGMKFDSINIPLHRVSMSGSKEKTYVIGVPQFESEIVFPKSIMEDLK
jgi:hypothetical protein